MAGAIVLAAIGSVLGVAGAVAGGSLLRGLLFETRTTDPLTYVAVTIGVLALAIGASVVPAVRAMRVDPILILRN
jgi:putative ABC transport system permease protein